MELMREMGTIGSSHGWVATLKDDGILRLQDDLNPYASYTDPKRISLPPLVTLPHCQTQVVANVSMSTSSPEDEDCVVAVKFLGPQLSLCRPAERNSEWTNIRIENPCFFSSQVMYSKKHDMFRMPGAGGHLMGSWNLCKHSKSKSKLQILRYKNLPKLTKARRDLLDTCCTREHLVESRSTCGTFRKTFLVKLYKKTVRINKGVVKMKTVLLMVFSLDEEGNAVYTQDIGGLRMFLSNSEPFCVPDSSYVRCNQVYIYDVDSVTCVELYDYTEPHTDLRSIICSTDGFWTPYYIPPQIDRLGH